MKSRALATGGAAAAGLLAILLGCGDASRTTSESRDLVSRFPIAATEVETRRLDLSDPDSRRLLGEGWSWPERGRGQGASFAWGLGERSTIEFVVLSPRDLELLLRCRAPRGIEPLPQWLTIAVNDVEVGSVEISPALADYRVSVPGSVLHGGTNELELRYRSRRSSDTSLRSRALAVAWYEIRFGEGVDSGSPRIDGNLERLLLPFETAVHYSVLAHRDGEIEIEGWDVRGEGSGELEMWIATDHGEDRRLGVITGRGARRKRWRFGVDGPARLSLVARETGESRVGGAFALDGLRLVRPVVAAPPAAVPAAAARRPNIVIYVVDTLRSDRLGVYGHEFNGTGRSLSPRVDAFAEDGVVFETSVAQSSWTRSAVASLLTGLWPGAHGTTGRNDRLPAAAKTLAEFLRDAGYVTAAVLGNPNISGNFGFRQGFEEFQHLSKQPDSLAIHRAAEEWVDAYDGGRPFFLYVHAADPHTPYLPPEPYRSRLAWDAEPVRQMILAERRKQEWDTDADTIRRLNELYNAEIAFNDDSFGALLDLLSSRGLYDETLVVFTSDHGEEFYEHESWTHGHNLYRETLDVPLIVKFPGTTGGRRVSQRAQQVDLVPTILELIGVEAPPYLDGQSLLPLLGAGPDDGSEIGLGAWGERTAYSHLKLYGPLYLGVQEADYKLVQRIVDGVLVETRLFDVGRDPEERHDLSGDLPIVREYLVSRLKEKIGDGSALAHEEALIDEDLARELRALGYIP